MSGTTTLPLLGPLEPPRIAPPTRTSLLRGILAYRWLVGGWMAAVFAWEVWERGRKPEVKDPVAHPVVGLLLIGAACVLMVWLTALYRREPALLIRPVPVLTELAVAATLLFSDAWVYGVPHSQALPTVWPLAGILTVALAAGTRPAVAAGIGLGLARYLGWLLFPFDVDDGPWSLSRIAGTVLFAVAGWVAGYLLQQQEASDREISAFRAREEVARTLHDGVLQTLAVIQRTSDDRQLVDLARVQELELRDYLSGGHPTDRDVASALRAAAKRAEQRHGLRVQVVCAPDLPGGSGPVVQAVSGAVGEALTNAAKHGGADGAVVYAEPADDEGRRIFVSVKDSGRGFDPMKVAEGTGLSRSIRGRVEEQGGRVEIDGRPDRGTEIRMWL